jgi:hypothetical protein
MHSIVQYVALLIKDISMIESQTADTVSRQKVMAPILLQLSRSQDKGYPFRRLYRFERWVDTRVSLALANARVILVLDRTLRPCK